MQLAAGVRTDDGQASNPNSKIQNPESGVCIVASSPILDLSYRNYDGPLEAPIHRWWAIAKMTMRLGVKKRGFWVWAVLSGYWYLILMAVFYFMDVLSPTPEAAAQFFARIIWKDQFLNAFSIGQLIYFILA